MLVLSRGEIGSLSTPAFPNGINIKRFQPGFEFINQQTGRLPFALCRVQRGLMKYWARVLAQGRQFRGRG